MPEKAHIADVVGVSLNYCQKPAVGNGNAAKQELQFEMCCAKESTCPASAQKATTPDIW